MGIGPRRRNMEEMRRRGGRRIVRRLEGAYRHEVLAVGQTRLRIVLTYFVSITSQTLAAIHISTQSPGRWKGRQYHQAENKKHDGNI